MDGIVWSGSWVLRLCALVAVLLACAAVCGGAAGMLPSRSSGTVAAVRARSSSSEARPSCYAADVRLGTAPGRIVYTVDCRRSRPGTLRVIRLGRYGLDGRSRRPRYQHIENHPSTVVSGHMARRATCRRKGAVIDCAVEDPHRLVLRGWFSVAPSSECAQGVSVRSVILARCTERNCAAEGSPEMILTDGRPRGC
jgi:hypothetical protein